MPPELVTLIGEVSKVLGPTGVLAAVMFYMWLKNRRNGKLNSGPSSSLADHDILIRIETNVDNMKDDIAEIKGDVKDLNEKLHSHQHFSAS